MFYPLGQCAVCGGGEVGGWLQEVMCNLEMVWGQKAYELCPLHRRRRPSEAQLWGPTDYSPWKLSEKWRCFPTSAWGTARRRQQHNCTRGLCLDKVCTAAPWGLTMQSWVLVVVFPYEDGGCHCMDSCPLETKGILVYSLTSCFTTVLSLFSTYSSP